jgi:hypothetical protein
MLIDRRPLTELINELPYGKFGELVRKEIDPLWGRDETELKAYRVTMKYLPHQEPEEHTVTVEAMDEAEAKKVACEKASAEVGRVEDMWVHKLTEIGA